VMICLTLDGATNIQGKQVINMMACGLMGSFSSTSRWSFAASPPTTCIAS
jgi:hypothetical protein